MCGGTAKPSTIERDNAKASKSPGGDGAYPEDVKRKGGRKNK